MGVNSHSSYRVCAEVCQASVVFGMGKDYYRTEVVESNAPEWNQEAHM